MRAAYADPPYIGQSNKHYAGVIDVNGVTWVGEEVDHAALIQHLETFDAWALSASAPSLQTILGLLGEAGLDQLRGDFRVMPWVKTFAAFKRNVRVAYAWEPVIIRGPHVRTDGMVPTRDFVVEPITMKRGLSGAKPERFAYWLFNVLGLQLGDEFHDLFPGSGAVTVAWEKWRADGAPKLKQQIKVTNEQVAA